MPGIPLNQFKLVVKSVQDDIEQIYIAPNNVSAVVLSAQITNKASGGQEGPSATVSATVRKGSDPTDYFVVKESFVPASEAINPLAGKLVLEEGDSLWVEVIGNADVLLSVLENANE